MALQTFNFPYHNVGDIEYPQNTTKFDLGGGYFFAEEPVDPIARTFKIEMTGMQYYLDSNGAIDSTSNPTMNIMKLIEFYEAHGVHQEFNYSHWAFGTLKVKFKTPLKVPKPEGNTGIIPDFTIELQEVPY